VLQIALEAGALKLGRVALDGTKVKANASKHKAMSYYFGLFQFHLVAHSEISIASATEPVFATTWTAEQIAAGNVEIWSTFDQYCDSWPVR
jgi:hypothetical protein